MRHESLSCLDRGLSSVLSTRLSYKGVVNNVVSSLYTSLHLGSFNKYTFV